MSESMIAVVKTAAAPGPEATEVREVSKPEPGPGEALIRVHSTAVCGTDKHIYGWDPSVQARFVPPRVYGHEFCGVIERLGPEPGRTDLQEGLYVSAEMHVVCGSCDPCRTGQGHVCRNTRILGFDADGCFASHVVVPACNVIPLDEAVVPRQVGAFLDALGNAVHTTQVVDLSAQSVLVTGYGPIGGMCAAIARFQGARRIYILEIAAHGLEVASGWAEERGYDNVIVLDGRQDSERLLEQIRDETGGGVDVLLETAGASPAINFGLAALHSGGFGSLLGLPSGRELVLENYTRDVIFKGVTLQGIIGRRMYSTWKKMLRLLEGGLDVGFLVTHEFEGLENFHEAMALLDDRAAMKVVFHPSEG